jgi:hypothetical protein
MLAETNERQRMAQWKNERAGPADSFDRADLMDLKGV